MLFRRYIGIDYSGAEAPTSSLKALRVFMSVGDGEPIEVQPPPSPRKWWTRKGIAEWLVAEIAAGPPRSSASTTAFRFR